MDTNSPPDEKKPHPFVIRRKRSVFNEKQLQILTSHFQMNPYPGIEERKALSEKIAVAESRIQVWFQNRRSRKKNQTSLASTNSGKCMPSENSSPSQIPKEDIYKHDLFKHKFSLPNATRCDSWSGPGEPHQEAGWRRSSSIEGRSVTSTTEATCSEYNISQDHNCISPQTMRSTQLQLCTLPRPVSQESQGPENHGAHTSFYGRAKLSSHYQKQRWTTGQLSSHYHPLTFQCVQGPPCELQQPPALLPLAPQTPTFQVQQPRSYPHQSSKEHQSQTQTRPLMKGKEQPNELSPSKQQEHRQPIDLYERGVGLGPAMLLPDGHLPAHPRDLDTTLKKLDDILRDLILPQGHLTTQTIDVVYKEINDLLTVLND